MDHQKVITYIDGYNLYYGLLAAGLRSSRWLDIRKLGRSQPGQDLVLTRYFTTRVKGNPAMADRQSRYIDALVSLGEVEVDSGHFLSKPVQCYDRQNVWRMSEEKKTDVNIAIRLLEDANDGAFDSAIVVSGDSDIAPAIQSVRRRHPWKTVRVAFPPRRHAYELRQVATAAFRIPDSKIRGSGLPRHVLTRDGVSLTAPLGWLPDP